MENNALPEGTETRNKTRNEPRRLLIIIPALNEHESISATIINLRSIENRLCEIGVALSIYVIDDGSSDNTGELALEAGADRVLRHRVNQGLGAAVRTGIKAGRDENFDILVKFDADLQHEPEDVCRIIMPIIDGEADLVYGNRFDALQYKMPIVRRVGNIVFSRLMKWLTNWPLRDSQPGIFAASREYLMVAFIPGDYNYTQQILLDAYHKNMRFAHVSVTFRKRTSGKSFVNFRYPLKVIPQIVMVIASIKPFKIFVPIGSIFMVVGVGVFVIQFLSWLFGSGTKPVENVNLVLGFVLFGLQTVFFGILAQLIVQMRR